MFIFGHNIDMSGGYVLREVEFHKLRDRDLALARRDVTIESSDEFPQCFRGFVCRRVNRGGVGFISMPFSTVVYYLAGRIDFLIYAGVFRHVSLSCDF